MKLKSIEIHMLYEFAKINPDVPKFSSREDQDICKEYRAKVDSLIESVDEDDGWYVWYDGNNNIVKYIGQAQKLKTSSLRQRIKEELSKEYVMFWTLLDEKAPEKLTNKFRGKYKQNQIRAVKKCGANIIFWVASSNVTQGVLDVVEHKLINKFDPKGNSDKRDYSRIDCEEFESVVTLFEHAFACRSANRVV